MTTIHHDGAVPERSVIAPPRQVRLREFVNELRALSHGIITKRVLSDFLSRCAVDADELSSFIRFSNEKYTRNLVFRSDMVEMLLICWRAGDDTPIHTHNGQLGWMTMLQGRLMVENYRVLSCNCPENRQVVGMDCLAGATAIDMIGTGTEVAVPGGPVNTVDKEQTIHRIRNLGGWNEPAISVHIYSRPIDSCVVFDMENQRCFRRDMTYDY
jgi:cysteine dioxygenase